MLTSLRGGSPCSSSPLPSWQLGEQGGSETACGSPPTPPPLPLLLPQVARTLMVTHIPKEITDPSLIIKHFQ